MQKTLAQRSLRPARFWLSAISLMQQMYSAVTPSTAMQAGRINYTRTV